MKHYDVIIIGGGIVGLSSAFYLGKAGKSVLILDKGDSVDYATPTPSMLYILAEARVVVTLFVNRVRLASTMETVGLNL